MIPSEMDWNLIKSGMQSTMNLFFLKISEYPAFSNDTQIQYQVRDNVGIVTKKLLRFFEVCPSWA